jgi:hypothetical protein
MAYVHHSPPHLAGPAFHDKLICVRPTGLPPFQHIVEITPAVFDGIRRAIDMGSSGKNPFESSGISRFY